MHALASTSTLPHRLHITLFTSYSYTYTSTFIYLHHDSRRLCTYKPTSHFIYSSQIHNIHVLRTYSYSYFIDNIIYCLINIWIIYLELICVTYTTECDATFWFYRLKWSVEIKVKFSINSTYFRMSWLVFSHFLSSPLFLPIQIILQLEGTVSRRAVDIRKAEKYEIIKHLYFSNNFLKNTD